RDHMTRRRICADGRVCFVRHEPASYCARATSARLTGWSQTKAHVAALSTKVASIGGAIGPGKDRAGANAQVIWLVGRQANKVGSTRPLDRNGIGIAAGSSAQAHCRTPWGRA